MRGIAAALLFAVLAAQGVRASSASPDADQARRVSVDQLEQAIATAHDKPDVEIAETLQAMTLTERLSITRFGRLQAGLPGEQSRQALTVLADSSAFLALPTSEIPARPTPDTATQRQIMAHVVNYVTRTLHELPNFFATRDTARFEDRPQVTYSYLPLHFIGRSQRAVEYRNGQEVADTEAGKARKQGEQGLASWGEFGPILSVVLLDAAQGKLVWNHWEPGPNGPLAAFSYAVSSQRSHYWVEACCNAGGVTDITAQVRERPSYHGEMAVDPVTGAILRITVEADLETGDPLNRADIMVEYGPVEIGGQTFTCPRRSVAVSRMQYAHVSNGAHSVLDKDPLQTMVNDVAFEQYHQLRSEARIITDAGSGDAMPDAHATPSSATANVQPAADTTEQPVPATAAAPAGTAAAPTPPMAMPAAAGTPAETEVTSDAAEALPDTPTGTAAQPHQDFVLKVNVRLVDVSLVALDKKGHPVTGLKATDLEVYDNGRKQDVKFFGASAPASAEATASAALPDTFSNHAPDAPAAGSAPLAEPSNANATILLFDESHIAWNDLTHARSEVLKFLNSLPPGERIGLYAMNGLSFRVLTEITSDHAAVIALLQKWAPTAQSVSQAHEDETRNRQQFDTVHNVSDLNSVNGSENDVPDTQSPVDPQLLTMGSDPARASLLILRGVARHLAAIPGHKDLAWISSDNVFVDWSDQQAGTDKARNGIESDAMRTQEAMNDAHVSVYPFDVSQLEPGGIDASMKNRNIELDPTTPTPPNYGAREEDAGRVKASMLQDVRPIQGPIRQVAEATGGRTIRRSSDLSGELQSIVDDEHGTYQLSFNPDTPADGKYHAVSVKLAGRKGITLRYRTGYFYAKEAATLKERLQQAIWQPEDAAEIRVTAEAFDARSGGNLKLNIAAADLDLELLGGRRMDKFDIFFIQRDVQGLHSEMEGRTIALRLKPETYQNALTVGLPFEYPMQLKPGVGSLRVLIVDRNTGRIGSVTIPAAALTAAK